MERRSFPGKQEDSIKMNRKNTTIIWILLIISLALSFSGFKLRVSNENNNTTIMTTVDYQEFANLANSANRDMDQVLKELKNQGAKSVAVKETTLRDLEANGDIYMSSFANFSSFNQAYAPALWKEAAKAIKSPVHDNNLTITSYDPEITKFLEERLSSRFLPEDLIRFEHDGKSYFIINAELDALVKLKNSQWQLDTRLGFDEKLLDKLSSMGFDIVLRPGNALHPNTAHLDEYEKYIKDYAVKTLIFDGRELPGAPDRLDVLKKLVKKYDLTIGIIETSQQLKYISQMGLDQLMLDTSYPISRVYSTGNDEFVNTVDERYYRWIRSVVDRSIRIMYVVPFKDGKVHYSENLDNTIQTIGRFHETIESKGYSIDQPLNRLSSEIPGKSHRLMLSLSLLLAGTIYLTYLFRPGRKFVYGLLGLGVLACIAVNLLLNIDFSKIYALAAAILYPAFSALLVLIYLRDHRDKALLPQLLVSLAIILGINMLGAYTIVSSLSDIRYIMNIKIFSGVKIAFISPLLLFVLNYFCCFYSREEFNFKIKEILQMKPRYLELAIFAFLAIALYIYLGRSGNTSGLTVSTLEIKTREILENIFLARPRFKEILIGYPALFAMVYLYKKYNRDFILWLGFAVTMGSISMVNSFSHVFTSVVVSANRTLAGLLVGTIIALAALIAIYLVEQLIGWYVNKQSK